VNGYRFRLLILAPSLIVMGWYVAGNFFLLAAYPFWIVAGLIWAAPLAELAFLPFGNLLRPGDRYSKKQPMYSRPESLRRQNKLEEAFSACQEIAREYPKEVKPWVDMIRIAHLDMKNRALADATLQQGLLKLKAASAREELERMHQELTRMRQEAPRAEERRVIQLKPGSTSDDS